MRGLWSRSAVRISRMLLSTTSGRAPSSRSFVPMSSTTAAGFSARTSSCSRISTPRVVSPLMPRLATFIPGNAAGRRSFQPCVIESPSNTTAPWSCATSRRPLLPLVVPQLAEPRRSGAPVPCPAGRRRWPGSRSGRRDRRRRDSLRQRRGHEGRRGRQAAEQDDRHEAAEQRAGTHGDRGYRRGVTASDAGVSAEHMIGAFAKELVA